MAKCKIIKGQTPNGGVSAEIMFLNDEDEMVDEEEATRAEVVEYNERGEPILRTYADLTGTERGLA